jgi:hypothetical protein
VTVVEVVAYLAPVLALVCALLLGRYPGERALRRRLARRRHPRRSGATTTAPQRAARTLLPRGGALLADGLAGRAPPLGSV